MTLVMLYVLPMLLGRTYDMDSDEVGVDIFPKEAIDNAEVIERYITDSQYKVVSETRDARDFLDVSGTLSLKIKTGKINVEGTGSYLKDVSSRSNMVEILVKVHYETVTLTIPSTAKPVKDWRGLDKVNPGTHYCRSIVYGGDLIASLRFKANNAADKQIIQATVQGSLQTESGGFDGNLTGEFNMIKEKIQDAASMEIHYYATVPLKGVPNDITSLMNLVDNFPSHTKEVNNGRGVPLRMELFPLSALDSTFPTHFGGSALGDQIDLLEEQFDDVKATIKGLREWMVKSPPVLPSKHMNKIGELSTQLETVASKFYDVINRLNLSQTENTDQFTSAFDAYDSGTGKLPDKYFKMLQKLKNEMIEEVEGLQNVGSGATYIHWGKSSCEGENVETLYSGWVAGAKEGGTELLCFPIDAQYDTDSTFKRYDSKLVVATNGGKLSVSTDAANKGISCAACRISKKRTSSTMLAGINSCSKGQIQYTGYLTSTDIKTRKKEFICLDGKPESQNAIKLSEPGEIFHWWDSNSINREEVKLIEATVQCGTLPCDEFAQDSVVPCVVCAY